MNRKTKARLAARKKASRPDRFIEDGYSHWKFSKGKSANPESKIENVDIPADEISQLTSSDEEDDDEDLSARVGDSQSPLAHSDTTLVTSFDPSHLSAEEISVLINSGEININAICRDSHGRFASCGAAGLPPSERSGVSEARMAHARHLIEQVRSTKTPDAGTVKELANHLGTMTVAQLHSLKKEYGLKASGKDKAALKEKLTARFSQKATGAAVTPTALVPKATDTSPAVSPHPPSPVHVPVGTFGTTKDITWRHEDNEAYAYELAQHILGPNATAHDLVSVAGIPDGARVGVSTSEGVGKHAYIYAVGSTQVRNPDTGKMESKKYEAGRTISLHPDGTRSIHNDSFEGKGSGLAMFGRQVENATKWGFTHIDTYAAGQGSGTTGKRPEEGKYNGYYTWPRFGYNGKVHPDDIERMPPDVQRNAKAAGNMLSGVMSTKEGRDWWMGHGESKNLKFDLTPGSYSQDTLNTYLKHRGVIKDSPSVPVKNSGLLEQSLYAEDISVLINSGELDVNAICRDWHGRFAKCGSEGTTPSSHDAVSTDRIAHARHLVEQVRGVNPPNPVAVKALADHLGTLTVTQLHSLKKEYGLKASGKNKAALKEKLTERFSQKAVTPPALPALAPKATDTTPASTPMPHAPKATEPTPVPSSNPPTPVHVPLGTFGTTKDIMWGTPINEVHDIARQALGSAATAADLVSIAGIPDGGQVRVVSNQSAYTHHITIHAVGSKEITDPKTGKKRLEDFKTERTLMIRNDGTKTIHNESFEGKGFGITMLGRQVENATKWGFTSIDTVAGGFGSGTTGKRTKEGNYNGYYTWPRLGYDGRIPSEIVDRLPPAIRANAEAAGYKLSGIMSTKGGRDWWMGHGTELKVKFDLTPGSYSQDTLNSYLKHRGILK
jgi:hypothetical protein